MTRRLRAGTAVAVAALAAGCTVGPNFVRPAPPAITGYRAGGDDVTTATLAPGAAVAADWWQGFGAPQIDALVARALAQSPEVEAAQERLRAAQANLRAGYGAAWPEIDASASAERARYSASRLGTSGSGSVYTLYTPSVAVGYALDLFGGTRRTIEGLKAQAEAQRQVARGTDLTLAANVASTAIARAAYHDEAHVLAQVVEAEAQQMQIAQVRVRAGTAATVAVLTAQAQFEAGAAALAAARQKAEQTDDQLAVLLGKTPAEAHLPDLTLAQIGMPASLPVTLPAQLVRQRPDVLTAEATARAATAAIGVAMAAMLPDVTVSAGVGASANSLDRLFGAGSGVWSYGAGITQPLFHASALRARKHAAQASAQAALADYHQTVLSAVGQVADTLAALQHDGDAAAAADRAHRTAIETLNLAAINHTAGLVDDEVMLADRVQANQSEATAISARAVQLQDCVALFAALGGGWPQ